MIWRCAALALAIGVLDITPVFAGSYQLTVEEAPVVVEGQSVDKLTINDGMLGSRS